MLKMIKRITLYIITLFFTVLSLEAQVSSSGQQYNSFTSRNFMKFNRFLTVPTFSSLRESKTTITAIARNSNIDFEDNPRLHVVSYAGKMRENIGAGFAIYQQEVAGMKDFGAIANYAQRLQLSQSLDLTFGFNFLYSRSSLDWARVLVKNKEDSFLSNFQDIPIVMLQPAVTLSFGKFDVGVFFENLIDFNLKNNELATTFGEKTISAHAMYSHEFTYASGIFEGTDLRTLIIARKEGTEGFSGAGTVILDLPKAGWIKAGYDKTYGMSAGLGVNISDKLAIGFSYEKNKFSATNEVGLVYTLGQKRYTREISKRRTGKVNITLPKRKPKKKPVYKDEEHHDLSDELQQAQDSINNLNKKVDEVLRILKNQPALIKEVIKEPKTFIPKEIKGDEKDTSLKRRSKAPWRESTITKSDGGGGGTMYYVVSDRYRNKENVEVLIEKWNRLDIEAKYIYDPTDKWYYVYIDRYAKESDAEDKVYDFNDKTRLFENNDKNDQSSIKMKKGGKDPVYVVKLTIGEKGDSYKEPKKQPAARVRTMSNSQGIEPGYYLQVYVNSKKPLADRNVDELRNDDIEAGYFINPTTGYMHVYIAKTDNREEIIRLYNSNLDGAFYDRKTIVHIK